MKLILLLKAVIRPFKYILPFITDEVVSSINFETYTNRVLIIRLDAIGDFVLWLDAAQVVVSHYKALGKRSVLLANANWADWARELGVFDEVIPLVRRKFSLNPFYRYRLALHIRRLGCSIAIQPSYSREYWLGDAIIRMSGAYERIGSIGDLSNTWRWQKRISDRWYTRLIYADPSPCMELLRNAEFVRGLTGAEFRAKLPDLRTVIPLQTDKLFLAEIPAGEYYYVLFPGASWTGKQWPVANYVRMADLLHKETGWRGVVCGGTSDLKIAEALCSQSSAPLLNWAGYTNLSQLAAVLSGAAILITNDTSATHLAAAVGIPVVCIFGGGHFGRFMPYEVEQQDERPLPRAVFRKMDCFGCNWRCKYSRHNDSAVKCIQDISVKMVWDEVVGILSVKSGLVKQDEKA